MRFGARVFLFLAALSGFAEARAQSAAINVSAIIDVVLVGQAVRDLEFGYVTPGQPQTVAPSQAATCAGCTSGKWTILDLFKGNQANRRNIALTFTQLPTALVSAGGATLPLTWTNAAKACLAKTGIEYYCFPAYTPVQGVTQMHQINGPGAPGSAAEPGGGGRRNLDVYLGGITTPTPGQRAGYYTGTITLQFAYSN